MLIFYIKSSETHNNPIVIIDAMSSDDRFSTAEIKKLVNDNMPDKALGYKALGLNVPKVYSCEYSMSFEHIGIPLGQGLKTKFSGMLKSPPAVLVTAFSPKYLTSSKSINDMANALGTIANPQTNIVNAAMVIKGSTGTITRQFIIYAAPLYPDAFGTTTTMVLSGAIIDDVLIKSEVACQIDKKTPLALQLTKLLAAQKPPMIGDYIGAPGINTSLPATEILFPPMILKDLLAEICLQNKLVFVIDKLIVKFLEATKQNVPNVAGYIPPKFSFLGSNGFLAWGLGVENYANVKFKSAVFDCKLFGKIMMYNDIKSAFFEGLVKTTIPSKIKIDMYEMWIIRYLIIWSRDESICEVTVTNNWLMAQFRIDGLLAASIYSTAIRKI